jgi:hypothetical protein
VIAGVVASWVKALSEPPLQAAAERILPPSPAQKEEVGADPSGRPENMPPAVLADHAAVAVGHRGLSPSQRGAGTARDPLRRRRGARRRLPCRRQPLAAVARGRGALAGLAIYTWLPPPRARSTTAAVAAGAGRGRVGVDVARRLRHRAGGHAKRNERLDGQLRDRFPRECALELVARADAEAMRVRPRTRPGARRALDGARAALAAAAPLGAVSLPVGWGPC